MRDLDAAALKLRDATIVILDPETPDDAVRTAIFDLIDRQTLDAAVERLGTLAEPHDNTYFTELRKHNRKIAYTPGLLAGLDLGAAPAGRHLLEAIEYLRVVQSGRKRSGPPPIAFAPKVWLPQLRNPDGAVNLTGYKLCVLDGLRRAIRRRDVFPVRSLRYADPRKELLSGPAWEAARPTVCRSVGGSTVADEELRLLSSRLDLAYRETAGRIPMNPAVTILDTKEGPDLSLERLEKIEEPASLIALRAGEAQLTVPRHALLVANRGFVAIRQHRFQKPVCGQYVFVVQFRAIVLRVSRGSNTKYEYFQQVFYCSPKGL